VPVDIVRDTAIDVLLRVFDRGVFLDVSLNKSIQRKQLSERGRRFLTQLVYGTVRNVRLCDHVLESIVDQPLKKLPLAIHLILRMAVFQSLFCNQVTHPAMVHTSVDLAKKRGHAGLARLTNAVLRRCPKTLEEIRFPDKQNDFHNYLGIRYSVPDWLVARWEREFGTEEAERLCEMSCSQAPVTIRVNTQRTTIEELQEKLRKTGLIVTKGSIVPEELTVAGGLPPARSKFFQEGYFIVQDAASMAPVHLVAPEPGECVLDMCAAPGGKTTHLAQLAADRARIVALDSGIYRVRDVVDNADRLGMTGVRVVVGDGVRPPFAGPFDRVLVDAPCSGLGTLRRHPDLKWRIQEEDIVELAERQLALLRSAIGLCKNGGLIVYSVCTFSSDETTDVLSSVLADGCVQLEDGPEWLKEWKIDRGTYRILPQKEGLDGFFLTRLRKVS